MKVTPEGKVKILDFGLAKAFEAETHVTDISQSPTLTEEMTRAGVILGTAAYMSPEQAKGKPVDKRADIFAFGAVLYELLTGKRAFQGETITETIAAVLKSEPDWEELPAITPWRIRDLLRRCLQQDVNDRLDGIANVRIEIKMALSEPTTVPPIGSLDPLGESVDLLPSYSIRRRSALVNDDPIRAVADRSRPPLGVCQNPLVVVRVIRAKVEPHLKGVSVTFSFR